MANIDDPQRFGDQLADELDRLDQHHPEDRPYVKQWVQKADGRVAESSLATYLTNLRTAADVAEGPLIDLDERGMDRLTYHLRHESGPRNEGFANGTVRNKQFAVRKFLLDLGLADWADDYDLVPPSDNTIQPQDMLRAADIKALTSAATNLRDAALIEFLADTGARIALVCSLRVGDLDLDKPATFKPNPNARGLKGAPIRDYPIIDSVGVMRTYLQRVHPRPDEPDAAAFHKLPGHGTARDSGDGSLTPTTIRQQLQSVADAAGVEKPVNPHNFRHSAITRMVREGYSRSQIEHRVAWSVDTDMWATYQHIAAEEQNRDIFSEAGVIKADDGLDADRQPCGQCQTPIAPHHEFCPRCGTAVTPEAEREVERGKDTILDALVAADDPETAAELRELLEAVEERNDRVHDDPS